MTWFSSATNGFFFGGWYADAGPYTGPWPLLAPGVLNPDDPEGTVDFVVALPNPAAPDDATQALDGSYDTNAFTARRVLDDTAALGSRDTYSALHLPDYGTATSYNLPTGAHLYVVAYSSDAPTLQPADFVPPSYAAGGAAAAETASGGWSDWQDGTTVVHASVVGDPNGAYSTGFGRSVPVGAHGSGSTSSEGGTYPPTMDPAGANLAANAALQANRAPGTVGSAFFTTVDTTIGLTVIDGSGAKIAVTPVPGGGYQESLTITLTGGSEAWTIIASPVPDAQGEAVEIGSPPAPITPDINQPYGVQLEQPAPGGPAVPQIVWTDFAGYIRTKAATGGGDPVNVQSIIAITMGAAPDGANPWSAPGDGSFTQEGFGPDDGSANWAVTSLENTLISGSTTGPDTAEGGFDPLALPLSSYQGARVVYFAVGFLGSIDVDGPPDPPTPTGPSFPADGGTETIGEVAITAEVDTSLYITDEQGAFLDGPHAGLPYTAINPRWRYWLPNPVVPSAVLRTVGGHFDTTPGTTVRMLQPSGRWLPIVKNA